MMTDISKLFRELGIVVGDIKCEPSKKYDGKTLVSYFIVRFVEAFSFEYK